MWLESQWNPLARSIKKGSGGLTPEPKGQKLKIKRTNDFNISKSSIEKKMLNQ